MNLVPFTMPSGRTLLRCPVCRCSVPETHIPGSEDCDRAAAERLASITADD